MIANENFHEKHNYRPEIDGLRAFAVIAVIINHFNSGFLPNGYLGVDIFFVISGYVITSSLAHRKSKNFWEFIKDFYLRRVKRLLPALVLFVSVFSILICIFNPDPRWTLRSGASSIFGINNIFLYWRSTDYFAESTYLNPFSHTWSLGIEKQFYFIYPFLIWFCGFTKDSKLGAKNLLIWMGSLGISSLLLFNYFYLKDPSAVYYLLPSRLWEISSGCIVYLLLEKFNFLKEKRDGKIFSIPSIAILTILVVMFLPIRNNSLPTILVVISTSILLLSVRKGTKLYSFLTQKIVTNIGLLSYSLYLWHWGVISISKWTVGIYWWTLPFQVLILVLTSLFSYRFIEKPLRNIRFFKSFLLASASLFIGGFISLITLPMIEIKFLKKAKIIPKILYSGKKMSQQRSVPRPPKSGLIFEAIDKNSNTIFAIGDSHLGHFYPMFEKLSKKIDFSLFINVFALGAGNINEEINLYEPRYLFQNRYEKMIASTFYYNLRNAKAGDLVIFSVSTLKLNNTMNFTKEEQEMFEKIALDAAIKGVNILVINQTPFFRGGVYELCEVNWYRPSISIPKDCLTEDREILLEKTKQVNSFYLNYASSNSNVFLLDAFSILCPDSDNKCNVVKNGMYLYADGDHITELSNKLVFNDFYKLIIENNLLK